MTVTITDIVLGLYIAVTVLTGALAVFGFALVSMLRRIKRIERMLDDFLGIKEPL